MRVVSRVIFVLAAILFVAPAAPAAGQGEGEGGGAAATQNAVDHYLKAFDAFDLEEAEVKTFWDAFNAREPLSAEAKAIVRRNVPAIAHAIEGGAIGHSEWPRPEHMIMGASKDDEDRLTRLVALLSLAARMSAHAGDHAAAADLLATGLAFCAHQSQRRWYPRLGEPVLLEMVMWEVAYVLPKLDRASQERFRTSLSRLPKRHTLGEATRREGEVIAAWLSGLEAFPLDEFAVDSDAEVVRNSPIVRNFPNKSWRTAEIEKYRNAMNGLADLLDTPYGEERSKKVSKYLEGITSWKHGGIAAIVCPRAKAISLLDGSPEAMVQTLHAMVAYVLDGPEAAKKFIDPTTGEPIKTIQSRYAMVFRPNATVMGREFFVEISIRPSSPTP